MKVDRQLEGVESVGHCGGLGVTTVHCASGTGEEGWEEAANFCFAIRRNFK